MLLFGNKIIAAQAENCGLVSHVFSQAELIAEAWSRIRMMTELPIKVTSAKCRVMIINQLKF